MGQGAIIGLQPENGETTRPYVHSYNGEDLAKTDYSRSSISEDFSEISLTQGIVLQYEIAEEQDISVEYGIGLFKGTQLYTVLNHSSVVLNPNNNAIYAQVNVAFGRELEDGVYQIRTIYKLAGQENWETCTDAYTNYVAATISGNNLKLRKVKYSEIDDANYVVNHVSYSGKLRLFHYIEVTVNLTNTGDTNQELLNITYINGEERFYGALVCGAVGPGETGDVVFPILLGGEKSDATIRITADRGGNRVIWEDHIEFEEPKDQNLTCSNITIDNLDNGILKDSKYHITMNVTNSGDGVYDDQIGCEYQVISERRGIKLGERSQHVLLNPGETKQIEFVIPVESGNCYDVFLYYYGKSIKFWNNLPVASFFVVTNSTVYNGINYAFSPNSKEASVLPGDYHNLESVSIPASIIVNGESYKVVEIAPSAFEGCDFQSVTLPEGLFSIGKSAFSGCMIKSISFPSTVRSIDMDAFSSTQELKEICIPEGAVSIGYRAFAQCHDLEILRLPSSLNKIEEEIIIDCGNLKYVYSALPDPIKIADDAFLFMDYSGDVPKQITCPATLIVPKGSVEKYQAASDWNVFTRITDKQPYKLTYYVDGEIYKEFVIEEETSITPEPTPTKETYVFSGWSEIPETMPDHDVIITGTFERHFDVGHVVNVVNFIMSSNATPEDIALYDMNNDNELNIGDIILIVKNILNNGSAAARLAYRRAADRIDFALYTAAQFELKVDKNASIKDIRLVGSMSQSHQLMCQQKDDNTYAVVVYSLSNQLMKPENGRIVDVEADGGNVMMQDITVATQTGEMHYYQDYGMPTDIHQLEKDGNSAVIYDLKGNRLNGVPGQRKGVYIINGKKVVVR